MYQDYTGTYDTSSRGSSSSPAHPDTSPIPASSYQKYRVDMPGSSSAFIPTINAITTSQDLQWMVQPTVITSMSNPYSRPHPYGLSVSSGPSLLGHTALTRPGVIRSIGDARGRRKQEEEKRRVRRERNKLAAAKCRNRRRELTDMLQGETEKLEEEKADLQKEIETLQKEKDKLEFMLVAHNPNLHSQQCAPLPLTMRSNLGPRGPMHALNPVVVKQEPLEDDDDEDEAKTQHSVIKPICLGGGMYCSDGDSLNTPVVAASTPVSTPNHSSLIFTYPNMLEPESPSPSSESCSKAHRRSSSSGDQSSDSLNSPTLLAL
ncbi:hypothetical protein PO909_012118 [Leuciscus waleckii]